MKRLTILQIFIALVSSLDAQQIEGIISYQNSGGRVAAGVKVNAYVNGK